MNGITIIHMAGEGGGTTILGKKTGKGWLFWSEGSSYDCDDDLCHSHKSVANVDLAELLPSYWLMMHPLEIHREFIPWFQDHYIKSKELMNDCQKEIHEEHIQADWESVLSIDSNNNLIKSGVSMQLDALLGLLKPKEQRGSKPRCHLLTHGDKQAVASRLTELIYPWGNVSIEDRWMPDGFQNIVEAELHKASKLLSEHDRNELKKWWLKSSHLNAKTPNWDIASTCTIDGRKGLLLVEAKAHDNELRKEESRKQIKSNASVDSQGNHEQIGQCIKEAARGLSCATGHLWNLSHNTHYQMANRFTWAWRLTQMNIPVILVYLGFICANEMNDISAPYPDEVAWRNAVQDHSKNLFPIKIWDSKWLVNNQPFIPLIRSSKQNL